MSVDFAALLKEIGRGRHAARALTLAQARELGAALADDAVPDGVLGALLIALRMKGESADELIGLQEGLGAAQRRLTLPAALAARNRRPLVIASYNGARRTPNLIPLLAMMLAALEIPVLIHGPRDVVGRTGTLAILELLGFPAAESPAQAEQALAAQGLAYVPIEHLAPAHARLLAWRDTLGVRNVGHTLVKLIEPFDGPALRLIGITHPAYRDLLLGFLTYTGGHAVLMRGHEGEAIASPQRLPAMQWVADGRLQAVPALAAPLALPYDASTLPALPADATARWIAAALAGRTELPAALLEQACRLVWMTGAVPDPATARARVHTHFKRKVHA